MAPQTFDSQERFYRCHFSASSKWKTYEVVFRETDLWIRSTRDLREEALTAVLSCRHQLHAYIAQNPAFLKSFDPLPPDPLAPPIVQEMLAAATRTQVGPMAAVAGAVAQHVGRFLRTLTPGVIVENGGDCYLDLTEEVTVGLYAGPHSPFSHQVGLRFTPDRFPLGVCTSSGTVGHSVSFGKADAVTVVSPNAALADAAATALGNLIQAPRDMAAAIRRASQMEGVEGVVLAMGEKIGAWGRVELVPLGT